MNRWNIYIVAGNYKYRVGAGRGFRHPIPRLKTAYPII